VSGEGARGALRILMISPQFRPLVGGYERAAERLALALVGRGHAVTVVAERHDPSWPARETFDGVELRRLWCVPRRGLHVLTSVLSLAGFLLRRGRSFDVVHVHQYGWAAGVAVAFGRLARRPVVMKLTATGADGILQTVRAASFSGPLRALLRRVDACLATSERGADEAVALGIPRERMHRIPNGVDSDRFAPLPEPERRALRQSLGLGSHAVALYVGRLSAEKNALGLLDAWRELGPPSGALLAMAGTGPERDAVAARAAKYGPSIRLLGAVADPLDWYRAADVFVLPSIHEGLSNSFLEALACGLPVVSTPVSGSEDVFAAHDVGILVSGPQPPAIAAGLAPLLADAARRARCGAAARAAALERFSLVRVAERVEALYRELGAGGAGAKPISRA
jgi:glycosyltransferase involved in cell wall biosynthesis